LAGAACMVAMLAKRIFDIVVALALLLVLSPFLLIISGGLLLTSPGSVFYRGLRTGRDGRPFFILKFRTMVVDAEHKGGGTTALNDPRIFPLGRVLRNTKLDELPQLFNVLRGEMSLVGPRPELPMYTDRYTPEEKMILSVPPGITDYSSIRFSALDEVVGERDADQAFEQLVLPEKNRLRLEYVRTRSFWVDITILVRTVWCVVRQSHR
jgi:lipopolysaccharide/colanic/teichoic acid biosynthesis glycosyltransferase